MPELPEVENVVMSLKSIEGLAISGVEQADGVSLKYNSLEGFIESVSGCQIETIKRRGKFILLSLFDPIKWERRYLIVHLAMTGALIRVTEGMELAPIIANHIFVQLRLSDDTLLIYSDYRRFGSVRVVSEEELLTVGSLSHLKTLQTMGVEPFDEDAPRKFLERIRLPKYAHKPIKDVLLDQFVIAGVGNIYASECLVEPKIYPTTEVGCLSDEQLLEVLSSLRGILERSIELGGTSIRDYVNGEGESGSYADHLKVYNQTHCSSCEGVLDVFDIKNRRTYACPNCQVNYTEHLGQTTLF